MNCPGGRWFRVCLSASRVPCQDLKLAEKPSRLIYWEETRAFRARPHCKGLEFSPQYTGLADTTESCVGQLSGSDAGGSGGNPGHLLITFSRGRQGSSRDTSRASPGQKVPQPSWLLQTLLAREARVRVCVGDARRFPQSSWYSRPLGPWPGLALERAALILQGDAGDDTGLYSSGSPPETTRGSGRVYARADNNSLKMLQP
ncbi:hypothetical protein H920_06901 [Fukomys damarensis]|uniref:Uncharacterized protein n=1 Tax=Fukomys damarensis TaxID=885580 RepID=A0A091DKX5_FUKDA|nr:hypothetical protein H920_06901 [Fukomys damarensis]